MKTKIYSKNNTERIENFLRENQGFQFSVLQIQQALQSDAIKPNLTTIYRQLEKLIASGKMLQFYSEDGNTKLFQINQLNCENHLHVRCAICGKISHLDCSDVDNFLGHINEEHHIKVTCQNSILFGVCSDCEKQNNTSDK